MTPRAQNFRDRLTAIAEDYAEDVSRLLGWGPRSERGRVIQNPTSGVTVSCGEGGIRISFPGQREVHGLGMIDLPYTTHPETAAHIAAALHDIA